MLGGRKVPFVAFLLAAIAGIVPAHADQACLTPSPCTGAVAYAWISPGSGEVMNTVTANGTFGYQLDPGDPGRWGGKRFTLTPASATADLDVYFYVPSETQPWDYTTGVREGPGHPETGAIPAGTQRAFVMISYTTPAESGVGFTFAVS